MRVYAEQEGEGREGMRVYTEHKRMEYVHRGRETLWSSRGGIKGRMGHGISPLRKTP